MARLDMLKTTKENLLYYAVDGAVGPRCLNERSDVLLVQLFLMVSQKTTLFTANPYPSEPDTTGVPDQDLFDQILHFQKTLKLKQGSNIATDGRVDPPVSQQTHGSISGTQYTIIFLNLAYDSVRSLPDLPSDGDCPGEIREQLKIKFVRKK